MSRAPTATVYFFFHVPRVSDLPPGDVGSLRESTLRNSAKPARLLIPVTEVASMRHPALELGN